MIEAKTKVLKNALYFYSNVEILKQSLIVLTNFFGLLIKHRKLPD